MSEIAAVLLAVSDRYGDRARASVAGQTVAVDEVVEIRNVAPFSRALNEGARRVSAPFFLQVDEDMILDPGCAESLRAAMSPDTGIAVGELRDALMGTVVGIKLFRTECFRSRALPDTIAADTDFVGAIARDGWKTVYVGRSADESPPVETLGEHRPDYTPEYTYRKHLIEGRRYWHRSAPHGLRHRLNGLETSAHPLAAFAQLTLGHGVFVPMPGDELKPPRDEPDALRLHAMLESGSRRDELAAGILPLKRSIRLQSVFRSFFRAGLELAEAGAGATILSTLAGITCNPGNRHALVAKIALGHGVLDERRDAEPSASDEALMKQLIVLGLGHAPGVTRIAKARVRRLVDTIRDHERMPQW